MPEGSSTIGDGGLIPSSSPRNEPRHGRAEAIAPQPAIDAAPSMQPVVAKASAWRSALLLFGLGLAAIVAIYIDTVIDLIDAWSRSGNFAHGFMIFPASAWLVWRIRERIAPLVPRPQPLALVPLVGCGLLWLAGHSAGVHAPEQYAFVAMIPCLVWAVFGTDVAKAIAFPLFFLFFAVPAGDFLMPTLMDHTADFTVAALRASGIPVFREGNYFTIPSGNWSIVEACSGLRYLIASITLGCLFAYLNYRGAWRRAAFIVASIIVPVIANWLRAYMIVMLAHLSSNKLATGVDHIIYGWLFFGIVMMALFWVGSFWRDDDLPLPEAEVKAAEARATQRAANPVTPGMGKLAAVTAAVVAVALPWPALGNRLDAIADGVHPGSIAITQVAGWQSGAPSVSEFSPHYLRARSVLNENFANGNRQVALFVGYFSGQLDNGPMVTYDNDVVVVGDKQWGSIAMRGLQVDAGGTKVPVVEQEIKGETRRGSERLLAWRWYWVDGRLTTSNYAVKAYNALDKLTGKGDDSAVVVVSVPIGSAGEAEARKSLQAFVEAAQPVIAARLAAVHAEARK